MPATILLGIGAGIAAYKAAFVLRALTAAGYTVHVIPTQNSFNFVGKTTWEGLSGNPVYHDVFDTGERDHIELAREADAIVIVPATADLVAKLAGGHADNLLTTTVLASSCPVIIAPAMHTAMWENAATVANMRTLRSRGVHVVEPVQGPLGSGDFGVGRLADPEVIAQTVFSVLEDQPTPGSSRVSGPLAGRHIVVTAGGTREHVDPVRFLGNTSSGRQGIALAEAAADAGARVTLIAANVDAGLLPKDPAVAVRSVVSAAEMYDAVFELLPETDCLVKAAAVADFRPRQVSDMKIKKTADSDSAPTIELEHTPDILAAVSISPNRPKVLVGFAAETGDYDTVIAHAREKAKRKNADLLAVNTVGRGKGFGDVPNTVDLMTADGSIVSSFSGAKLDVAVGIMKEIITRLGQADQE